MERGLKSVFSGQQILCSFFLKIDTDFCYSFDFSEEDDTIFNDKDEKIIFNVLEALLL